MILSNKLSVYLVFVRFFIFLTIFRLFLGSTCCLTLCWFFIAYLLWYADYCRLFSQWRNSLLTALNIIHIKKTFNRSFRLFWLFAKIISIYQISLLLIYNYILRKTAKILFLKPLYLLVKLLYLLNNSLLLFSNHRTHKYINY